MKQNAPEKQIRSQMPVVFEKTQSFAREYQWSLYISGEHVLAGFVMQYNYSSSNRAFTRDISYKTLAPEKKAERMSAIHYVDLSQMLFK